MVGRAMGWSVAAGAVLVALALAAQAHDPDMSPAEAPGHPGGLAGLSFFGPVGTPIETMPCDPISDADADEHDDGLTGHIGHISRVEGFHSTTPTSSFILPGSVDLWHFYDPTYNNPAQIEGPSPPQGVMLGTDGFFRGEMSEEVPDLAGIDVRVTDVHETRTYCLYGALEKEGPFFFIDSTYRDPVPTSFTDLDLSIFYAPLFSAHYPGELVRLRYFMPIASVYDDPGLAVDFDIVRLDAPLNLTYDPGVKFVDKSNLPLGVAAIGTTLYAWDFGDGGTASGFGNPARTAFHEYTDDGTYTVCLTITTKEGDTDRACKPLKVNNRPPAADFECPFVVRGSVAQFADGSKDRDGLVSKWVWEFGDGDADTIKDPDHQYEVAGDYSIKLTVWDDDDASGTKTRTCPAPGIPNRPPVVDPIPARTVPAGSELEVVVTAYDPDGDAVTLSAIGLPPGATFDPVTGILRWRVDQAGFYPDIMFLAQDPDGLFDVGILDVRAYSPGIDSDLDGVRDDADNCPGRSNGDQGDGDRDGRGDGCTLGWRPPARPVGAGPGGVRTLGTGSGLDTDGDTHSDEADNCPATANRDQQDRDADGLGDMCDADEDGDGVSTEPGTYLDNCPAAANPDQADADKDGRGDACDADAVLPGGPRADPGTPGLAAQPEPESAAGAVVAAVGWALGGAVLVLLAGIGMAFLLRRQGPQGPGSGPGNP